MRKYPFIIHRILACKSYMYVDIDKWHNDIMITHVEVIYPPYRGQHTEICRHTGIYFKLGHHQ